MTHPPPAKRGPYRRPRRVGWAPKHGSRALAKHLAAGTLDGRTWVARALKDTRDDLAADRGGWDHCTAAERILIDRAAALSLIVQSIEAWVFSQAGVVTPDGEMLSCLKKGYATHSANLARMLVALGLRPDRADQGPTLAEYLASRTPTPPSSAAAATEESDPT